MIGPGSDKNCYIQTIKLADFKFNLGFGSRVSLCGLIWYKAKILGWWDQKDQSDLQIWCTPGNTNHTRVPIDIFYPTRCHEFYLVWCDISKSHCEEDPSNYAGLQKEEQLLKMEKIFVPRIKLFHMALPILVLFVLYSMFNIPAKRQIPTASLSCPNSGQISKWFLA